MNNKEERKIKVVFLDDLYKEKVNYFIDLKNVYTVRYHKFQGDSFLCSKTGYNKKEIFEDCECLMCHQKIQSVDVIYADILIFNKLYQYDNNKILLLSKGEYQLLLSQKKYLFLNDDLDLEKVYSLFEHLEDNKSLQVKKMKSYETGVKNIMNLTKNYAK